MTARDIFVSDLHLFHPLNGVSQYQASLVEAGSDRIFLAGDVIDYERIIRDLKHAAKKEGEDIDLENTSFANVIKKIGFPKIEAQLRYIDMLFSKAEEGTEVIYIPGNHDEPLAAFDGKTIEGIRFENNLIEQFGDKKFFIEHGHLNDPPEIKSRPYLYNIGSVILDIGMETDHRLNDWFNHASGKIEKFAPKVRDIREQLENQFHISNSLKKIGKFYIQSYRETAAARAEANGADGVICGHIHNLEHKLIDRKGATAQSFDTAALFSSAPKMVYLNIGDGFNHGTALTYDEKTGFSHLTRRDIPLSKSFALDEENPYAAHRERTLEFLETCWEACKEYIKEMSANKISAAKGNKALLPGYEAA